MGGLDIALLLARHGSSSWCGASTGTPQDVRGLVRSARADLALANAELKTHHGQTQSLEREVVRCLHRLSACIVELLALHVEPDRSCAALPHMWVARRHMVGIALIQSLRFASNVQIRYVLETHRVHASSPVVCVV